MPGGAYARLMKANLDRLIEGASNAALNSLKQPQTGACNFNKLCRAKACFRSARGRRGGSNKGNVLKKKWITLTASPGKTNTATSEAAGEIAYVQDRGYIIHDENNKPVRMVGAMRDITTEKLFEIERNKITSDLMQRNKDLEQFAYIVSHNLRAPVANVIGFADDLADESLDATIKARLIQQLDISAKKLDMVIKDIKNVLQLKRQVNENKETNLSKIAEDIKLSISKTISSEEVSIVTKFFRHR
jgi:signal transduction histidine kinase